MEVVLSIESAKTFTVSSPISVPNNRKEARELLRAKALDLVEAWLTVSGYYDAGEKSDEDRG